MNVGMDGWILLAFHFNVIYLWLMMSTVAMMFPKYVVSVVKNACSSAKERILMLVAFVGARANNANKPPKYRFVCISIFCSTSLPELVADEFNTAVKWFKLAA